MDLRRRRKRKKEVGVGWGGIVNNRLGHVCVSVCDSGETCRK